MKERCLKGGVVDLHGVQSSSEAILRIRDVLRTTGLSKATLYKRIAAREFPRPISLGGRAVGWLQREVEGWISDRVLLRPEVGYEVSDRMPEQGNRISGGLQKRTRQTGRGNVMSSCILSIKGAAPDPAQLHLVGTKVYFDRGTGNF